MKKIFCAAIILAAAYTINAQEVVTTTTYKTTNAEFNSSQVPSVQKVGENNIYQRNL